MLAPVLFNVFLLAITLLCAHRSRNQNSNSGLRLRYRCDGGAFRLQRFKSVRKSKYLVVRDLQYADDAALVTGDPTELQRELNVKEAEYTRLGLKMNTNKTEVMHKKVDDAGTAPQISVQGNIQKEVKTSLIWAA